MKLYSLITPFLFLFLCGFLSAQKNYNTLVYEGNNKFNGKNYDGASSNFMEAIKKNGNDFTAHYNLGNALYKRKMFREAEAEYKKAEAFAKTKADKAAVIYNQGNVQMQNNNHEKAAELYKKSLKIDPYNEAVRKNYAIAKLKEQQQGGKNGNDNKKNSGGDKGKDNNQTQDDKNGKSPQQQAGKGNPNNQQGQGKGNGKEETKNENSSDDLPKDLQQAILNRVGNKERETARRILNKNAYSMPESNEKDW